MVTAIQKILQTVAKPHPVADRLGTPLKDAFIEYFGASSINESNAIAIICMLYLSHRLKGFPIDKLRLAVYNIQEICPLPKFNCNHYTDIMAAIPKAALRNVPLYNSECEIEYVALAEKDILEAFDFYTNR